MPRFPYVRWLVRVLSLAALAGATVRAIYMAGPWCVGIVLFPLAAAVASIVAARRYDRRAVPFVVALMLLGGLAAAWAWQAESAAALAPGPDHVGPQGMDALNRALWSVMMGSVGAMVASTVAARARVWDLLSWYVVSYLMIALPAFGWSQTAWDESYERASHSFGIPVHAFVVGYIATLSLVAAAVIVRRLGVGDPGSGSP